MRAYSEATPCPAAAPSGAARRVSFAQQPRRQPSNAADDTANIEFTTELRGQMRSAKPRRRGSIMPRSSAFDPALDIWQDVGQEERQRENAVANEARARVRRTSILERPAVRAPVFARKAVETVDPYYSRPQPDYRMAAGPPQYAPGPPAHRTSLMRDAARPRRVSGIVEHQRMSGDVENRSRSGRASIIGAVHLPVLEEHERPHPLAQSTRPNRDSRRRTMWVPSDDTTIETIHPGAKSYVPDDTWRRPKGHDTGLDLVTVSEEENSPPQPQQKRQPRMSLAAKPRKAPLQLSRQQASNFTIVEDVIGEGGGKENIPPGQEKVVRLDVKAGLADIVIHFDDAKSVKESTLRTSHQPSQRGTIKTASLADKHSDSTTHRKAKVGIKRSGSSSLLEASPAKLVKSDYRHVNASRSKPAYKPWTSSAADWQRDSRYSRPDTTSGSIDVHGVLHHSQTQRHSYRAPIIAEDLAQPELYEEHWLSHQEIAVAQVLNQLLDQQRGLGNAQPEDASTRPRLLRLFQDADTLALTKRLQASLQYGALAIPADLLPKVARLESDIGLRRSFFDLWINTYDLPSLKAALEVVIGREVVLPKRLSSSSTTLTDDDLRNRLLRKGIERFIQAYLISHDDASKARPTSGSIASIARHVESHGSEDSSRAWRWRRTMLRSLMIIHLLDRAKSTKLIPGCLFQKSSPQKSSVVVLQALSAMLFPSAGDITRPLHHLHYSVSAAQHSLEEFEYKVDNLATDMRDGIVLARVVELLHFRPSTMTSTSDATMTMVLPSGEILESLLHDETTNTWLLSQHLKLPCIGRAQKLFNVQISLSALASLNGATARLASSIRAEDVVDGHRERTMGLLWGLVSQNGLGLLVDETGLKSEIWRLKAGSLDPSNGTEEGNEEDRHSHLLQQWATAVGRRHGVHIANLTTSFADGRALEAIVAEYIHFLPSAMLNASNSLSTSLHPSGKSLSAKLKAIGCSSSFVALFAPASGSASYPFSRSFTLLTLSYLAARLLPLTTAHRAAVVLQQWYRRRLQKRNLGRRMRLMRIAHDCATVVNTRNTVVGAATTIQRAWRNVLDRRMNAVNEDVTMLQALVRGWRCRQNNALNTSKQIRSVRARGGW